jgi:hypothetical protein
VKVAIVCAHCGKQAFKEVRDVNRASNAGCYLYCDRACAGLGRRIEPLSETDRKAAKAAYDREYRKLNRATRKVLKAAYYQKNRDPAKEREYRAANMGRHVEYCRRPEYREYKKQYDREYNAKRDFGEFWECAIILLDTENEIATRISRTEVYANNGTLNKKQSRRRDYERTHRV